jgi:protein-S-isoprenylcysteine O-methyltransferase Ste14/membrane-associated phospholipid phosphatase
VGLSGVLARIGYGALFCAVLPLALWAWSRHTVLDVHWPLPAPRAVGFALLAGGTALLLAAMHALWRHGGGLPMNAFPPPRLVAAGPYRWLAHPIYVGFVAMCAGAALATGSGTALYVVTPIAALGALALVLGHEGPALAARFPGGPSPRLLELPRADAPLLRHHRASVAVLVLLPWLLLYLWVVELGPARDAVQPWLPGERGWPVLQWTYAIYASAYPLVATAPIWARGAAPLADFARAGLAAIALHTFLYLVVPIAVPPRAFVPTNVFGEWLAWEGAREASGAGAFPSFHTTWAWLTATLAAQSFPRLRTLAWLWAAAVAASCVTTGMHAVLDVAAGTATFALVHRRRAVWATLRAAAERTANGMRTWRVGPLRVFVHAGYAGLAAALVAFTMTRFVPREQAWAVAIVCASAVLGAAAWAQWIEGAAVSLRPFGYYGSVAGAALALAALPLAGVDPWPLAGGIAVAAPFAQSIGRLRCLVQGCCHGRPAPPGIGIVCTHPLSRAVRLAHFGGVPLHATQLYSLLWNVPCGVVLLRCAQLGQPPSAVTGLYLVGNGLGRFVEEQFRGEPQARRWKGLVEYQWYAIASVLAGGVLTCVPSVWPAVAGDAAPGTVAMLSAATGLAVAFAMGVDFPDSDRRFARLLK